MHLFIDVDLYILAMGHTTVLINIATTFYLPLDPNKQHTRCRFLSLHPEVEVRKGALKVQWEEFLESAVAQLEWRWWEDQERRE